MAVSGSYMLRQQNFYVDNKVGIGTTNPQLSNSGSVQIWYNVSSSLFSGHSGSLTYLSVAGDIISTEEVIAVTGSFTNITASTYYLDLPQGSTSTYVLTWNAGEVTYGDFENTALSTSIWKTNTGVYDNIWASNAAASVGIGISTPSEKLEVYGTDAAIQIDGAPGGTSHHSGSLILHGAVDSSGQQGVFGRILFHNADAGGAPGYAFAEINAQNVAADPGASSLRFFTGASDGTLTFATIIDEEQRVGIGTSDPVDSDLHVWGNVSASAYYGDGSNLSGISAASYWSSSEGDVHRLSWVGIGTAKPSASLHVHTSSIDQRPIGRFTNGTNDGVGTYIYATGSTMVYTIADQVPATDYSLIQGLRAHNRDTSVGAQAGIHFSTDSAYAGIFGRRVGSNQQALDFYTEDSSRGVRMTIEHSGEVGINTTDAGSSQLRVHGAVSASSYRRTASIPIVWQGSVYDTITPPIRITDTFEHSKYMCSVVSGSCYVKIEVNDTTVLYTGLGVSASVAGGWQTGTPGGSVGPWVDGDYIRVEVSQSKGCEGLSVSFYMTY